MQAIWTYSSQTPDYKTRFTFQATWIHPGFSKDAHFIGEGPQSARPFTSATQAASLPISLSVSVLHALSSHDSGQVISRSTPSSLRLTLPLSCYLLPLKRRPTDRHEQDPTDWFPPSSPAQESSWLLALRYTLQSNAFLCPLMSYSFSPHFNSMAKPLEKPSGIGPLRKVYFWNGLLAHGHLFFMDFTRAQSCYFGAYDIVFVNFCFSWG